MADELDVTLTAVEVPVATRTEQPRGLLRTLWDRFLSVLTVLAEILIVLAVVGEICATVANIYSRHVMHSPLAWTDDLAGICLDLIAFLGGAVAIHSGRGMSLTFFVNRMQPKLRATVTAAGIWGSIFLVAAVARPIPDFLRQAQRNRTPALGIPTTSSAIWLVVGFALLLLYLVDMLSQEQWRTVVGGFLIAAAAYLVLWGCTQLREHGVIAVSPVLVLLVGFALSFMAAVPIAIVLAIAAVSSMEIAGNISPSAIPVAFESGISSFVLLAIPFFMLAGVLMEKGGLAKRLVDLIAPLVSRLPGGMLISQVVSVYVFSGISGSKTADIAAIGSVMRGPLAEAGYAPEESTAVLAASAAMSETVPPSLAIIVLASITSLSPGSLFIAGIVPAAAMAIALIAGITWRGRDGRYPRVDGGTIMHSVRALPAALPALFLPVILVYGIVAGLGTPTEISAIAAVYGLLVVTAGYRSMKLIDLWRAIVEATVLAGVVLLILSTATLLSQVLTIEQLPQHIASSLGGLGGRPAFLILSVLALIVLGSLLEGLPSLLVFGPLLLPVAMNLGISGLQYGVIMLIAMGIGSFAPPIGAGLFVAAAIGQTTVEKVMRASFFYTAILIGGLAVVVAVPALSTYLPHVFGHN